MICLSNFLLKFHSIFSKIIYSSFLNGVSYSIGVRPLTDSSGYYVTGCDSANRANIWKYLFSSPTTSQWQQIPNFNAYVYGQLKLSDNNYFMIGYDPLSPYSLHFYRHTFGNSSPDWSLKMLWPSGTWSTFVSESLLISSSIYTFFPYGSSFYIYMAVISLSNGSVSSRYKSSIYCTNPYIWGSGVSEDYIVASIECSSWFYLLIFNKATNEFNIKIPYNTAIYKIELETATNR